MPVLLRALVGRQALRHTVQTQFKRVDILNKTRHLTPMLFRFLLSHSVPHVLEGHLKREIEGGDPVIIKLHGIAFSTPRNGAWTGIFVLEI